MSDISNLARENLSKVPTPEEIRRHIKELEERKKTCEHKHSIRIDYNLETGMATRACNDCNTTYDVPLTREEYALLTVK